MGRVRASGAVSKVDIELFALAVSDMRFLFDEDLEQFVSDIHDALLKKHALDALLEKAVGQADQALMDKALRKSREQVYLYHNTPTATTCSGRGVPGMAFSSV